jgi:ankyrin repeat protein
MTPYELHRAVKKGDLHHVGELLSAPRSDIDVNERDPKGWTPLMYAVSDPRAAVTLVRTLLHHGASIDQGTLVSLALGAGDPQTIAVLLEAGADLRYQREHGYDALVDAVHGRDVLHDPHMIDLLHLLIANGVSLTGMTTYGESGVRVLSRIGRFDAVQLLLKAGADATDLKFTPLMEAVAFGARLDVAAVIERSVDLEERDYWERTAWLLALQIGDIPKAKLLLEHGADGNARGRCGKPSLFYAIENGHVPMLKWLLEIGTTLEHTDDFGCTPLITAVECCSDESVEILLQAGVDVNQPCKRGTALSRARTREIAMQLLKVGADPLDLTSQGRRAILGYLANPDEEVLDVSRDDFLKDRSRRFGTQNPEKMTVSFWEGMVRSGMKAYQAGQWFGEEGDEFDADYQPTWCAQRFGQSITFLPDGRIVQVAGEHEDHYDPDFCIYNDVFVHDADGTISLYGYPAGVFPPTDFHTATLIGSHLYLIGSLGYVGRRHYGETPVYRLDTNTFHMERLETTGNKPGWIYKHRAMQSGMHEIRVIGGEVLTFSDGKEYYSENASVFILDIEQRAWRVDQSVP